MQAKDLPFIGTRVRILTDAAEGIAYLHCPAPGSAPLLHLDIKRCTILVAMNLIDLKLNKLILVPIFYLMDTGEQKCVTLALLGIFLSFHLKRATSVLSLSVAPGHMQRTNIWMDSLVPN